MLTASQLKIFLRRRGLRLSKRLGQHHLVDAQVITRVIESCPRLSEETVIEIGAGLGALTEALAQRGNRVVALEVDRQCCDALTERLVAYPQVRVACQDILTFSWEGLRDVTVAGTIPYHITSPILVTLCEARRAIRQAILIIQYEVAQRLLASPGTKAYGRLSILGQYGWHITRLFDVPRSAFFPQPTVDSCCVRLVARAHPAVEVEHEPFFFQVVKAAFAQRRKMLVNCLIHFASQKGSSLHEGVQGDRRTLIETVMQRVGLPLTVRGEALSLEQFAALANALLRNS